MSVHQFEDGDYEDGDGGGARRGQSTEEEGERARER
jgi:hypothetical protein